MSNFSGNQINPAKLLLSKWTAVVPRNKEKHFLVSAVNKDEEGVVLSCTLEAVLTGNIYEIDWKTLKDNTCWSAGWLS
ncbi:MAG: TIGR02450 family Trp-rich protein [Methyloglobulus sp.]|nr:TIGR02450 family Trp-rich protein [Methyloglobulus sp.]